VPGAALAGKTATAGDQSLALKIGVQPPRPASPGKGGVTLTIDVDYESLNDNAQISENTKAVTLRLPKGLKLHTDRADTCKLSDMQANGESACPDTSRIGSGSATADARPAVADPIDAGVRLYNGIDDVNPDGTPRDTPIPAVILFAHASINVDTVLPFDIKANTLELDYAPPAPGATQLFHLQKVHLTIPKRKGSSFVTAPGKCTDKGWGFGMTIDNYDGPSVTATDRVACKTTRS